eukprot:s10698_g1.t1
MAADADALAKKLALGGSELRFLLVHHKAAGVVVAWKTATLRVERQAEAEATNEASLAAKSGDLEDRHIPAKEYIEKKLAELEHPGREELKDVTMALFERYKEYLLGDYCYLVLQYEHAIRKHAYKVMATAGYWCCASPCL